MVQMDRRGFLKGLIALTTAKMVDEVIPFNRKWFFPKTIPIKYAFAPARHYDLIVEDDLVGDTSFSDCTNGLYGIATRPRVRANFAELLAPGLHQIFTEYLKDEATAKEYFDVISTSRE